MALQFGLADFQTVHPTEIETVVSKINTGTFDDNAKPIYTELSRQRRKPVPIQGARVIVKGLRVVNRKEPVDLEFEVAPNGRAICAVTQDSLPQIPMECEFELHGPKGLIDRGKVRCGGNEQIATTEIALKSA